MSLMVASMLYEPAVFGGILSIASLQPDWCADMVQVGRRVPMGMLRESSTLIEKTFVLL
jgi:hypothetical protein